MRWAGRRRWCWYRLAMKGPREMACLPSARARAERWQSGRATRRVVVAHGGELGVARCRGVRGAKQVEQGELVAVGAGWLGGVRRRALRRIAVALVVAGDSGGGDWRGGEQSNGGV